MYDGSKCSNTEKRLLVCQSVLESRSPELKNTKNYANIYCYFSKYGGIAIGPTRNRLKNNCCT